MCSLITVVLKYSFHCTKDMLAGNAKTLVLDVKCLESSKTELYQHTSLIHACPNSLKTMITPYYFLQHAHSM